MKIMEVSIEEKDCTVEMITPPRKKMKQAQLPFQMVNPLSSSNTISSKKRKLESPSPVESKTSKSGKLVKKQNTAKRVKASTIEVVELDLSDDREKEDDQESCEIVVTDQNTEQNSKEINTEEDASKLEETTAKDSETEVKKKNDYTVLDMFLKKAQSKEAKDDIQLLAMSDYESDNSKHSSSSSKTKVDSEISKENSGQNLEIVDDKDKNEDEIIILNIVESEDNIEQRNTDDTEEKTEVLETKNVGANETCPKKDSAISDDYDAKNRDSDSELEIMSSDEDADDEPDKSSNENGDRAKSMNEIDECKTPQGEKSSALKNRKLTPKQIERRLQNAKKREKRQQLKLEKERKREEEREMRRKEKEERRKEKEEKEKIEKEQKRKEKEMKELKKQMEIEQKQKEKEAKEEERRKRDEEKMELERKKQKEVSNFANFFVAKKQDAKAMEEDNMVKDQNFMPFEIKIDMRVAPITRRSLNDKSKLTFEELFNKGVSRSELYVNELKKNCCNIGRSEKTWPHEAKDDIVVIDEDDSSAAVVDSGSAPITEKYRPKFLMFVENRRPPYFGTWRKKSNHVKPRRPFAKDVKWLDYDVDSDEEWEEEEPGESIRGSDDERDEEGTEENEYDVDNDFMVPHGYLSDEEAKADEEDGEDMSPETQKLKLKLLGEEFEAERKTKTSKIKPKVIGCVWQKFDNTYPENASPNVMKLLEARQAWVSDIPIAFCPVSVSENATLNVTECGSPATQTPGVKKKRVPEEAIPNLIRLVHGNINGRIFLVKEFMAFWEKNKTGDRQISKLSLSQKIKEIASWIACPEEGPMHMRSCWYVREEVRKYYDCLDLTLPNRWEYTLQPTRRSDVIEYEKPDKIEKEKKRIPLITQFTKKITQEEMQKQLVVSSKPVSSQTKPPKRVALISVPRGEQFNNFPQNNLTSKFISCGDPLKRVAENQEKQISNEQKVQIGDILEKGRNNDASVSKSDDLEIKKPDAEKNVEKIPPDAKNSEKTTEKVKTETEVTKLSPKKNKGLAETPKAKDEANIIILED